MLKIYQTLHVLTLLLLSGSVAHGNAHPRLIGQYGKWSAYEMKEDGHKVCYMLSQPVKQQGNFKKRDQVYAMITHRPKAKSFNVVSFHAGYPFAADELVDVKVGKDAYQLFTDKDAAWTNNENDGAIVNSIKKGDVILVTGKSLKGTETEDTYSLKGSTQAYQAISRACGLE
jgi:hypothetical protein